ncbi:MAG: 2TM domain-containing protein [Fimbriimonadaceae bacterium]
MRILEMVLMAEEHLQSDDDLEAILKIAVREGTGTTADLRDRLQMAADELGLSPEQLAAAEEKYKKEKSTFRLKERRSELRERDWQQFRKKQKSDFFSHFTTYLTVNAFMFAMDWMTGGGIDWAYFPLLGWGIGVTIHMFCVLNAESSENQKEFEKFHRKQMRKRKEEAEDEYWDE